MADTFAIATFGGAGGGYAAGYAAGYSAGVASCVPDGDLDHSPDQLFLDGLETITLDGTSIPGTYRHRKLIREEEPSEGVYLSQNVRFDLPVNSGLYPGSTEPTVGGAIVDGDNNTYTILEVLPPYVPDVDDPDTGDYWGCTVRDSVVSGTYSLDNTVTHYPAVDALTSYGSRTITHPAANASFTDVPAKIMLRPSEPEDHAGQREFTEVYDIYVDGDIGQIANGDILKDEDAKQYKIVSFRQRDRIDELSVIECELRPR